MFIDKLNFNSINGVEEFLSYAGKHKAEKIYIFGCGVIGKTTGIMIERQGIRIAGYLDNNEKITEKYGKSVIKPDGIRYTDEKVNIIICDSYYLEKFKQIEKFNNSNIRLWLVNFLVYFYVGLTPEYIKDNIEKFEKSYNLLEDDRSKFIFENILNAAITSNMDYYKETYSDDEYFPEVIKNCMGENEIFVDVGAYNGDTVEKFINVCKNKYKKIYAFEPEKKLYEEILKKNIKNLEAYNFCLYNKEGELKFKLYDSIGNDFVSSTAIDNEIGRELTLKINTLDNIIGDKPVSIIKMDIEGSELCALEGAKNTVKNCKPKLAICVYHKKEDLIDIIQYIYSICPEYKFYLRHHSHVQDDIVLYCVA
ncbi:FkbM family methyltransferase [Peptoanaerobacter stomatis]